MKVVSSGSIFKPILWYRWRRESKKIEKKTKQGFTIVLIREPWFMFKQIIGVENE